MGSLMLNVDPIGSTVRWWTISALPLGSCARHPLGCHFFIFPKLLLTYVNGLSVYGQSNVPLFTGGTITYLTVRSSDQFTSLGSRLHDIIIIQVNVKVFGFSARKYPSCMPISFVGQP